MKTMRFIVLSVLLLLSSNMTAQVGVNNTNPLTVLDVNGAASFRQGDDFILSNGNISGLSVDDGSLFHITGPTGNFSINDLIPVTDSDGHIITFVNTTDYPMTIMYNTGAGASSIYTSSEADIVLDGIYSTITMQYNSTLPGWVVLNYADKGGYGRSIHSVAGVTDLQTNSASFSDMTNMTLTFTPKNSVVYVNFSASGHMYVQNIPQGYADFRLVNVTAGNTVIAGGTVLATDNDYPVLATPWNIKMNMIPVSVTPGVSTTLKIQWRRAGTFPNILFNFASTSDLFHRNFTVID